MIFVPSTLIKERYHGAMASMGTAVIVGSLLQLGFFTVMRRFPGLGVPEILADRVPRWIRAILLCVGGTIMTIQGIEVITGFTVVIYRFISPDIKIYYLLLFTIGITWFGATRSSRTVMILTEMTLLLNLPIAVILLLKSVGGSLMDWDSVFTVANHLPYAPSFKGIAAASFVFTGFIPMSVMNRLITSDTKWKGLWLVPIVGAFTLCTSYFIPIGYHGTEAVATYVYPWTTTSDSLELEYGVIERAIFLFSTLYLNLSMLFAIVAWHVGLDWFKNAWSLPGKVDPEKTDKPLLTKIMGGVFVFLSFGYVELFTEEQFFQFGALVHEWRFGIEILMVCLLFVLARRKTSA